MRTWTTLQLSCAFALGIIQAAPLFAAEKEKPMSNYPVLGEIIRLDSRMDELVPKDSKIEVLASGFDWSEGPIWISEGDGHLLFSDIPRNSIMKWSEKEGISLFMKPSGYTGVVDYGKEPGSNGLTVDREGRLLFCEHGDRRVSMLTKEGGKKTLADNYLGKRLNSPNDLVVKSNGDIFFTDPPYGLPNGPDDPRRELDFCGVYRLSAEGELTLLTDRMSRPNGLAFSPDEKLLYVANSDPKQAIWMVFDFRENGTVGTGKVFADVTEMVGNHQGLPDGLKVDQAGNLFATGPGGVHVFAPDGKPLGRIDTREKTANCAWGNDGTTLYLCADMHLCRVKTTTKGAGWK